MQIVLICLTPRPEIIFGPTSRPLSENAKRKKRTRPVRWRSCWTWPTPGIRAAKKWRITGALIIGGPPRDGKGPPNVPFRAGPRLQYRGDMATQDSTFGD